MREEKDADVYTERERERERGSLSRIHVEERATKGPAIRTCFVYGYLRFALAEIHRAEARRGVCRRRRRRVHESERNGEIWENRAKKASAESNEGERFCQV